MGDEFLPQWEPGWDTRLRSAAMQLGFSDFLEFMQAHVGEPYGIVLRLLRSHLGYMVPMMQIQKLHMREAIQRGCARDAAKDSLVRALREHVSKGWNKGKRAREKRALAFSEWVLPCVTPEDWEHVTARADTVWEAIETIHPPDDWCPQTPSDSILGEAFDRGWPAQTRANN